MTVELITLDQVKAEAQNVLKTFGPSHLNPGILEGDGCRYTDEDGQHCVAGQILVNLGLEVPGLMDDDNESTVVNVDAFTERLTVDALGFLGDIQSIADQGVEWSTALVSGLIWSGPRKSLTPHHTRSTVLVDQPTRKEPQ